ncbi:MAG: hypothetical protein QOH25_3568 [Acidobacteriota bacterium]|jgi:hypothetical protein|nr:hypothetical protein [Acidobacteriota bacterium]
MRHKILVSILGLALVACAAVSARAQDEEEAVRGSFLTTRVTTSTGSGNASAAIAASANTAAGKPSGKTSTGKATKKPTGKTSTRVSASGKVSTGKTTTTVKAGASVDTYSPTAIGLGYSLYMRDDNGNAMRVDPSREFRAGDRIRLSLETNTDGYLYIFHTENNGEPQMLYPDMRLDKGDNRIEAHVPYEIPWNEPGVENWFRFDANPANERLYIVVTRQPLPGIPTSDALVNYCGQNRCPWRPPTGVWAQVKMNAQAKVGVVKSTSYGQKQSQTEQVAVTRGLGLDQSAPEPSVIRMNATSNAPILVTAVDLIHK